MRDPEQSWVGPLWRGAAAVRGRSRDGQVPQVGLLDLVEPQGAGQ